MQIVGYPLAFCLTDLLESLSGLLGLGYVLESLLQQLLTTVANDIAQPLVDPQPSSVQRIVGDADGCLLECGPKALLALPERLLGPLALGSLFGFPQRPLDRRNEPLQPLLQYVVRGAALESLDRPLFPQGPGDENERDVGTHLLSNL